MGLSEVASIKWLGQCGMTWSSLLYVLFQVYKGPVPGILLIHLGGNDFGLLKGKALVLQAREDLGVIMDCWPSTAIIWSAIMPRRV